MLCTVELYSPKCHFINSDIKFIENNPLNRILRVQNFRDSALTHGLSSLLIIHDSKAFESLEYVFVVISLINLIIWVSNGCADLKLSRPL